MDLICYVQPGWAPRIRPASPQRDWMDATQDKFAYRCLPLNIANAHGWEMLSPCGFSARWSGGNGAEAVEVVPDEGAAPHQVPVSLFGHGTITFHVEGVIRTPEGWNLWAGGAPNRAKDGIAPLGGVIETDWSPYTFTMNWRFTRSGHWIRFEEDEPFCFIFPVKRGGVEAFVPKIVPIDEAPDVKEKLEAWSRLRDAFHEQVARRPPERPSDSWQKLYYRGADPDGRPGTADHQTKLRAADFARPEGRERSGCPFSRTTR